jgi:hypothetical protein
VLLGGLGLGSAEESLEPLVEAGRPLDRVAGSPQHRAVCAEALLEHVADGLEGVAVRAGHDELRKRRGRQLDEGDLRSHGPRSAISARTDRSISGVSGDGALYGPEPIRSTKARRKGSGSSFGGQSGASSPTSSTTAGCSGATPNAGGSATASERSSADLAASSATMPP